MPGRAWQWRTKRRRAGSLSPPAGRRAVRASHPCGPARRGGRLDRELRARGDALLELVDAQLDRLGVLVDLLLDLLLLLRGQVEAHDLVVLLHNVLRAGVGR